MLKAEHWMGYTYTWAPGGCADSPICHKDCQPLWNLGVDQGHISGQRPGSTCWDPLFTGLTSLLLPRIHKSPSTGPPLSPSSLLPRL